MLYTFKHKQQAHTLDRHQRAEQGEMDNMTGEEYSFFWETLLFDQNQEHDCLGFEEVTINPNDSNSPEETPSTSSSPPIPRNIVMERRRRQLVGDKLKALRSVVPFISKLDKASIIKDAIDYIQMLQEQVKRMEEEIKELVPITHNNNEGMPVIGADHITPLQDDHSSALASGSPGNSSIEVIEIKVYPIEEKTFVVNITCNKKRETMRNVCDLFDQSLNLKVINANITSISRSLLLLHTFVVESEELNCIQLEEMMKGGIAKLNTEGNPIVLMN